MMTLRFFYLGLSSVGFISYFMALKIAWQKVKFCEISGIELVKSGLLSRATISFHKETVYQFHLQFDHVACGSSYKNGKSRPTEKKLCMLREIRASNRPWHNAFLFCVFSSLPCVITAKYCSLLTGVNPPKCTSTQLLLLLLLLSSSVSPLHVWYVGYLHLYSWDKPCP
jgi:hypothetical protein